MLKYIGNIFNAILPSVLATVIGAYIVNHYVLANRSETPPPAATASAPDAKKAEDPQAKTPGGEAKQAMAPADGGTEAARSKADKAEKPARATQSNPREKAVVERPEKSDKGDKSDKAVPLPLEKTAKAVPLPVAPPSSVAAAPVATPPEAAGKDDHRDAADLARAAIERLRSNSSEVTRADPPHPLEVPRMQEPARAEPQRMTLPPANNNAVAAVAPALPAPVAVPAQPPVSAPMGSAAAAPAPATTSSVPTSTSSIPVPPESVGAPAAPRRDEAHRLAPPAEIPGGRQSDGDAGRSVGDDVLSAAQSVIHAVIPR